MPDQSDTSNDLAEDYTEAQRRCYLRDLRFPPVLKQAFRDDYERKTLPGLRGGLLLLLLLFALQSLTALAVSHSLILSMGLSAAAILVLIVASLHPRFSKAWQPAIGVTFCLFAWHMLSSVTHHAPPPNVRGESPIESFRSNALLLNELLIVVVGFALTRLRFVWFTLGSLTISALTVAVAVKSAGIPFAFFSVGPVFS